MSLQHAHGAPVRPGGRLQGRTRSLDAMQMHELIETLLDEPEAYLAEIQDWVELSFDIHLDVSTIHRIVEDLGFTFKFLRKVASERDPLAREEWMAYMQATFVPEQLVFVDESSKDDRTIFRYRGRAPAGQRVQIEADFVRGDRYSILASITYHGYLPPRIVEGSVNSIEFLDYIASEVVCVNLSYPSLILIAI